MSKTLDNVKTYGKKLGVISVMTVGNLAPMALNTMTQMGVAHANTNVTAGNKQQGLDVNVPHTELDKAVSEAKKAGVNVTNKGNKSVVVNSADSDKTQKAIASDYDSQVKALKSVTDTQLANNAKYVQNQKDYAKNLADWNAYWKNPDIVGGQTDWTKSDLMKFLGGDGANATYINASKQMKLDMGNLKAVSKTEFNKVKKTMKGTIIKSMSAPEDSKHVMVKISKGSYFKYTKAVKNNKTDNMVDIKYTTTNLNDKKGNKLAHYIILDKTDIGADQMQPMKDVSWGMDFYKAGTNVAENMDPLVGAADVDGKQYIKIKGASSLLIGKNLKKGADGLVTSSDQSVEPEDTSNQAWYLLKNVTHVDFTYGTNDNPNGISNWSDDYWTMGNIDFAVKLKPKPVAPTKPKNQTASYQLTDLTVKPSNHKDVTEDNKSTSINGKEVKIDQVINYPFTNSVLPAHRVKDIDSFAMVDNIPDGLTITDANKKEAVKNFGSDWKLDIKGRKVTVTATDSLRKKMNADKNKAFTVPTPKLPTTVSKGGVTIKNHVDTIINGEIDVTSNTVVNPTEKTDPSLIVKKVETSDGKFADDVANANIIDGKEVAFDIFSQVDNMNATNDVNYSDQLPKDAKVDVSKIKVYMSTDKIDASTMTKDKLTTLSYKTDVTKDFDISFKDGKLTYMPKAGKAESYKGKQLKVRFMTSIATNKADSELEHKGANYTWKNTASNGTDNSNTPDYHVTKDPSLIVKKVETSDGKFVDDVANANIIDGKEVAFDIFGQIDNLDSTKDINYSDQLPKDAKVDVSKIKVYMSTDKVDASTMTKDKLTTLSYKTDVTKDFDISFKDGKLTYTPKAGKAESYKGKQLKVRFMTSIATNKADSELEHKGANYTWKNTASNGTDNSNTPDYHVTKDPSLIVKKVETSDGKFVDDVANANIIDGKEVAFDIFGQIDNLDSTKDINYSDQLPKDAKVDVSKIKVYMSTDKVDASTMTKDKLTTLSYKTDVTKDFDISFKDGKLTYTPKAGKAESYKGKQLKVRFMTSILKDKVASELDSNGNNIVWNNTASNGKDKSNNADYNADKPKAKTEVKTEVITKMAQTGYSQSWFDKLINFFK